MNKYVVATILCVKLGIFLLIFLAYSFFPFNVSTYLSNFTYPYHTPVTLQTSYMTWDAQHYLFLSEKGYHSNIPSDAFPLLYPFLIHLGTQITRNSFWSGILLSNLLSLAGLYMFYTLVKHLKTEKIAFASLLLLLAFPTSFYFSLIYTESLFFFLVMLFFWLLYKKHIILASAVALLLPLTRLIGVVIISPFLSSFVIEYHHHKLTDEVVVIAKKLFHWQTLLLLSPLVGLAVSLLIMYLTTGNFFTQFFAQQNFVSQYSFLHVFNLQYFFRTLFTFPLALHGFTNSLLDRLFFLGFVSFLPSLFKRVSFTFSVYTVFFGLLPILGGSFMSYMRYVVIIFPLFITLGTMSQEKKYQRYMFIVIYLFLLLQSLFIIMQSLNYWVA